MEQSSPSELQSVQECEESATIRAASAERELEFADLRAQLKGFEGRYLPQVGVLYAKLGAPCEELPSTSA